MSSTDSLKNGGKKRVVIIGGGAAGMVSRDPSNTMHLLTMSSPAPQPLPSIPTAFKSP